MTSSQMKGTPKDLGFGFGIEAEYLLLDKNSRPLFHEDLDFETMRDCVDSISVADLGTAGFNIKPLHKLANPYLIEGYYLTDSDMKPHTLLPKGIEVRTPIRSSIDETIAVLADATERLQERLSARFGYQLCSISHHPTRYNFQAAPNYKRHDYWQWALTAMTTYGPDINISLPGELASIVDQTQLKARLNFYMPAVIALTFASPLFDGQLWRPDSSTNSAVNSACGATTNVTAGKSVRTYNRSQWAPLYYIHTEPALRFEFKGFEMPRDMADYGALFLISLALLLDPALSMKTTDDERIANLRYFAEYGLQSHGARICAGAVLQAAERTALRLSLDASCLKPFWTRLETGIVPADEISASFAKENSLTRTLQQMVVKPANTAFSAAQPQVIAIGR